MTRGEPVKTVEGTIYEGRMVILEFAYATAVSSWMADPDYQKAMTFRHASSTMKMLLLQEGGANQNDPDPRL